MKIKIDNFVKELNVDSKILEKYKEKVPKEVVEVWQEYGFGTFLEGYLKVVNPEDFKDILKQGSQRFQNGIVLFATAMGDLIIWSDNYVRILNFRYGINDTIMSGFDFFFDDLEDTDFREEELKWSPYQQAIKMLGTPEFDECFGYVPILGVGGSEKVENLEKVKLTEHLLIIISFMGPIA